MIKVLMCEGEGILQKFLFQNKVNASEDVIDYVEGCLLDNVLYACGDKYIAVYEAYQNSNASYYRIEVAKYSDKIGCTALLKKWQNFFNPLNL